MIRNKNPLKSAKYVGLLVAVLFALGTHTNPAQAQADLPDTGNLGFSLVECPVKVSKGYTVECGTVTVPENHARPNGPSIRLAVAIVHSASDHATSDPVLFIAGGPGGRTLDNMSFWLEYINPLLAKRDVIFFDQRGTGYSEPVMECPEIDPRATDPLEVYGLVGPITACRNRLTGMGIDLSTYNSAQNAGDIAALREALGYEEWNLYGVSYGSRVALTVLRDRPQGVRSVILDAMTPVEADNLLDDPASSKAALQTSFAACRADVVCRTIYPDLEQTYTDVVNDLAVNPVTLEIVNSKTGESKTEVLDGVAFDGTVLGMLGSPEASGIPGLVYEVRAGNYESIIASMETAWELESEKPVEKSRAAIGLQLAVICNEEAPFVAPGEMEEMLATYPTDINFFAAFDEVLYKACRAWGIGPANPLENMPVTSDVPTLILAGEYDAARSPAAVRRAAERLANSTVVEFPGAGHSVVLAGECPLAIMSSFLDNPASAPDTGCIVKMDRPQFYVTVGPTRSIARIVAVLAGVTGLSVLLYAGIGLGTLVTRRRIAWRVVLRRVGWRPLALNAMLSAVLYLVGPAIDLTIFYEHSLAQMIAIVGPLVIAIQTAFLIAPSDEPGLEMLLACPRAYHWLFIERVVIALSGQSLAALVVMIVGAWFLGEDALMAMGGWISSVLFLSGLTAFVSVRSRKATMGVLIALLAWLVFGVVSSNVGDVLIPAIPFGFPWPWPRPWALIQPLIWMAHPFLRPDSLTLTDFWLNRVIVGALGLGLMGLATALLTDTECLLLGTRARKRRSDGGKVEAGPDGAVNDPADGYRTRTLGHTRQRTRIAKRRLAAGTKLAQLGAMMRYELLMGWRRGTLRAILLSVLLFPQVFYLVNYLLGLAGGPIAVYLTIWPEAVRLKGTDAAITANITTLVMIILLLPLVLAELIPLDRQYRVREIIDTLPITRNIYLAGKLLSAWPVIVIGMALSALLSGTLAWIQNGPYYIGVLVAFWMTGLIPLALFASQVGVMLPARQSNRRHAVLMGLVAAAVGLVAWFILPVNGFLFAALVRDGFTLEQLADPLVRAASPGFPDAFSLNTLFRIGSVSAIMAAVWIVTARAMRREQSRCD
jgi:pimeloyl-ACP methyl ester carboxylesterase